MAKLLLLGQTSSRELAAVAALVRSQAAAQELRETPDVPGLRRLVFEAHWYPDLVVALQAWSDQFSAADVRDLLAFAPLSRVLCVYGPWCDSDGRTRTSWPLAVRVPAPDAAARIARELAWLQGVGAPAGGAVVSRVDAGGLAGSPLPLTASRAEVFVETYASTPCRSIVPTSANVESPDPAFRHMLLSALRQADHTSTTRRSEEADRWGEVSEGGESARIIVWDADPWDSSRAAALSTLRSERPAAGIIACAGFPEAGQSAALVEAGADAVWFKLSPLELLREQIQRLLEPGPSASVA